MKVEFASLEQVDALWPLCLPLIEKVCARDDHDLYPGELWTQCRSGQAFLIIAYEPDPFQIHMASVWAFERDVALTFRCLALSGAKIGDWLAASFAYVSEFSKRNGATSLTVRGRRGWGRLFPKHTKDGPDMRLEI